MQYKTSEVLLCNYSATAEYISNMIDFIRELVADLQEYYTFYDKEDTLETAETSPFFTGEIKLYIDSEVYLEFAPQITYGSSGSYGSAPNCIIMTLCYLNNVNQTRVLFKRLETTWNSTVNYIQYTLFKSGGNVFLSIDYRRDNTTYINSRNNGLRLILGEAHVIKTNQDVKAVYGVVPAGTANFDNSTVPSFLNQTICTCLCCKDSSTLIPETTNMTALSSNVATMSPCAGVNSDIYMNNLLVSQLIPDNFASSFSIINYNNKRYFQIGRFICQDT